jgi:signal recognition particle receptor subunit beta
MAFFDRAQDSVVLRVVYDGLGMAGKTTNIDQIHDQFSAAREGDVYTPEVLRGRTLYFDWLELHAGRVAGHRARCQIITVPGQFAYVQRRWALLRHVDAVVAVCDSSASALPRAQLGFEFLRRALGRTSAGDVPVVVQANKQDVPGALGPEEIAAALAISAERVIPATARSGLGVRRTLLCAIHAAVARLGEKIEAEGLGFLDDRIDTPQAIYERIKASEDSAAFDEATELADAVLCSVVPGLQSGT